MAAGIPRRGWLIRRTAFVPPSAGIGSIAALWAIAQPAHFAVYPPGARIFSQASMHDALIRRDPGRASYGCFGPSPFADPALVSGRVDIAVYAGPVVLVGVVGSSQNAKDFEAHARSVSGVASVMSYMQVI